MSLDSYFKWRKVSPPGGPNVAENVAKNDTNFGQRKAQKAYYGALMLR